MTETELIADIATRNLEMLKMTVADFSDADMFARPVPEANHAAWQIGHLAVSETMMVGSCQPGVMPELPAGFADRFSGKTTKVNDPAAFATKAELLDILSNVRAATVKWIKSLDAAALAKPTAERMRGFAPTIGHLTIMIPGHLLMHLGQIQVIRRKLGKPVLF